MGKRGEPMYTSYRKSRSGIFSMLSRNTNDGQLSFGTSSFSTSLQCLEDPSIGYQAILCRRGTFNTLVFNGFRKIFQSALPKSTNSKRLGFFLLLVFALNLASTIVLFLFKNKQITCKVHIGRYSIESHKNVFLKITQKDCTNLHTDVIDNDIIYVYYKIAKYPFQASSFYKLHNKDQLGGKLLTRAKKVSSCKPYDIVEVNGIKKILHPCGAHLVNVYNDRFTFFDHEHRHIPLDESKELLSKYQEDHELKNPTPKEIARYSKKIYFWLNEPVISAEIQFGLTSRSIDVVNGLNKGVNVKESVNSSEVNGESMENGHFIQWMTPAPFQTFTKLYGAIKGPVRLPLSVNFENNFNVKAFHGDKSLILVVPSWPNGNLNAIRLMSTVFAVPSTGRRHPPGRREKKETRRTPSSRGVDSRGPSDIWSEYMEKFDIARVHGSGVYVDLGATVQMGNYSYRMPNGKCPVAGKVIQLESGADFLNPISADEARDRGIGFPETRATSRGNRQTKVSKLSPVSASALRNMDYRNDTDLANCAEYAKNIVPGSDRNSKYRYPFVYDSYNKMCHILYSPMQYNQGAKYCDNNSMDEGLSSLICMYPQKSKTDAHLYYGSANVALDWDMVCPMHPVKDSMFGKWNGEFCELIHPHHEESASSPEECSEILFEYSPSDIDVDAEVSNVPEVDQFWKELRKQKFADAFTRIFSFASPASASVKTGGVGANWANFNPDTQTCNIFDVQPTCLILNAGHYALTSLSSPSISNAIPYPCSIKSKGYIGLKDSTSRKPNGDGFVPYTANDKKTLKCDKYVHSRYSESCGYYYECSEEPVSEWFYYYILISILLLVAFGLFVLIRRWWKNRKGTDYDDEYYCNNFYDKDRREQKWRRDEQLNSGAYVWGNGDSRPSDVTPVRLYKHEQ